MTAKDIILARRLGGGSGGSGAGSSGQSDWNQNDATAADYVKNRPGGYMSNPAWNTVWSGTLPGDMSKIEQPFVIAEGATYNVTVNGATTSCVGTSTKMESKNCVAIANFDLTTSNVPENAFMFLMFDADNVYVAGAGDYADKSASVSAKIQSAVKIPSKYLDTELLESAIGQANQQSTAVKSDLDTLKYAGKQVSIKWNGVVPDGAATFVYNGFNYYRMGDYFGAPINAVSIRDDIGSTTKMNFDLTAGTNCYEFCGAIAVVDIGVCSLPLGNFYANSAGVYLPKMPSGVYIKQLDCIYGANDGKTYGIVVNSFVPGSSKKFKITVDDTGTLTATEVTK